MIWEYEPSLKVDNTYRFEGPYSMTLALNGVIKRYEIRLALKDILDAVEHYNGLAKIQKLKHKTSKRVIWIVDAASDEQIDRILEKSRNPMGDLLKSRSTVVMLPEEYAIYRKKMKSK